MRKYIALIAAAGLSTMLNDIAFAGSTVQQTVNYEVVASNDQSASGNPGELDLSPRLLQVFEEEGCAEPFPAVMQNGIEMRETLGNEE